MKYSEPRKAHAELTPNYTLCGRRGAQLLIAKLDSEVTCWRCQAALERLAEAQREYDKTV